MAAVSAVLVAVLAVTGSACGDHQADPEIPVVDFAPDATITVDDAGITCMVFAVTTDCSVPTGTAIVAENIGTTEHRLVATLPEQTGNTFDTGTMQPGDTMTLVLTADGQFTVTDTLHPEHTLPLTVVLRT